MCCQTSKQPCPSLTNHRGDQRFAWRGRGRLPWVTTPPPRSCCLTWSVPLQACGLAELTQPLGCYRKGGGPSLPHEKLGVPHSLVRQGRGSRPSGGKLHSGLGCWYPILLPIQSGVIGEGTELGSISASWPPPLPQWVTALGAQLPVCATQGQGRGREYCQLLH